MQIKCLIDCFNDEKNYQSADCFLISYYLMFACYPDVGAISIAIQFFMLCVICRHWFVLVRRYAKSNGVNILIVDLVVTVCVSGIVI